MGLKFTPTPEQSNSNGIDDDFRKKDYVSTITKRVIQMIQLLKIVQIVVHRAAVTKR